MKLYGIILAAGFSSRMGSFKPLMPVNGFPLIQMTAQNMFNAGIEDVCLVLGHRSTEIMGALKGMPFSPHFVFNDNYQHSDMLESIKVGISFAKDADAVMILPGDIPLVSPHMIRDLILCAEKTVADVVYPVNGQRRCHPVILKRNIFEKVLYYTGNDGLRGILRNLCEEEFHAAECRKFDVDCKKDYEELVYLAKKERGISQLLCNALLCSMGLSIHERDLCRKKGRKASTLALRQIQSGGSADVELCRCAATLRYAFAYAQPQYGLPYIASQGYEAIVKTIRSSYLKKSTAFSAEADIVRIAVS